MAARITKPGDPPPPHGTYSRYNHWKCRCEDCRGANRIRKRIERTGDPTRGLKAAQHGSRRKYNTGCRCALCKEASRVYQREYMARKRAEGADW